MIDTNDAEGITEHELTQLIHDEAQKTRKSNESPSQAFARFFDSDEAIDLRKAHRMVVSSQFAKLNSVNVQPVTIETGRTDVESDAQEAYDALMRKAEELRRSAPYMTVAQAFERVFSDQTNVEVAARALRRGRADVSMTG